jgi:hypothetical protein
LFVGEINEANSGSFETRLLFKNDDSEHRDVSAAAEACEHAKLAVRPASQRHTPQVIPMTVVRWRWSA